jgi:exopolysaccharide production protein ExoZ
MRMTGRRLDSLDFLRGAAILGVIAFHVFGLFHANNGAIRLISEQGFFGVQLFFIVSALTMCLMWERRAGEHRPAAKFYVRRFFRIAPPFWLAAIFYTLIDHGVALEWAPDGLGLRQFVTTATFVHTFWPDTINSVVPGGWSIGVEMLFYLFFPMIVGWRCRPQIYLLTAVSVYLLNIFLVRPAYLWLLDGYSHPYLIGEFLYFQFFNQAPIFLAGIWLYRILHSSERRWSWSAILGFIWIALAFFLKVMLGFNSSPFFWLAIACLLAAAYVVLSLRISWRPLNRLGEISYSVYLTHFAVVRGLELLFKTAAIDTNQTWAWALALALTLSICLILGSVLEATVEKGALLLGRYVVNFIGVPPENSSQVPLYGEKSV